MPHIRFLREFCGSKSSAGAMQLRREVFAESFAPLVEEFQLLACGFIIEMFFLQSVDFVKVLGNGSGSPLSVPKSLRAVFAPASALFITETVGSVATSTAKKKFVEIRIIKCGISFTESQGREGSNPLL